MKNLEILIYIHKSMGFLGLFHYSSTTSLSILSYLNKYFQNNFLNYFLIPFCLHSITSEIQIPSWISLTTSRIYNNINFHFTKIVIFKKNSLDLDEKLFIKFILQLFILVFSSILKILRFTSNSYLLSSRQ